MKVGIVGMPNAGKSSLFNALTRAGAEAANYPFTTIEPNVAVAYSGPAGRSAEYARAAANEDDAWALGKLNAVGVAMSAGRSSNAGRARRKIDLIAVLRR